MVKRGAVVLVAGRGSVGNKPRPALVLQDDAIVATDTVVLVPFTSMLVDSLPIRPRFEPDEQNGLRATSDLMVDKVSATARAALGPVVGALAPTDLERAERAMRVVLGLAR